MIDVVALGDGTVLLDAHTETDFDAVREAQRSLAEYRMNGYTTIHVVGRHAGDHVDDELDVLGRVNVRLNIHWLIAVGEGAHAVHRAAQHEGSWDGESIPVFDVDHAYDEVVVRRGPDVAVLVTGSTEVPLGALISRMKGESA